MKKMVLVALLVFLGVGLVLTLKGSKVNHRQNFVIAADKEIYVLALDHEGQAASLLIFPPETWLPVVENYGYYQAGSLTGLDKLAHKDGELLRRSMEEFLAVPIDRLLTTKEFKPEVRAIADLFQGLRQIRLRLLVRKIKPEKLEVVDLAKVDFSRAELLPNGDQILKIDQSRLDELCQRLFAETEIKKENLSVSVLNATSFSGLAQAGSRYALNLGSQVIEVADWSQKSPNCQILAEEKLTHSRTYQRLKKTFDCRYGGKDKDSHRADLVLILGEDYFKKREGF